MSYWIEKQKMFSYLESSQDAFSLIGFSKSYKLLLQVLCFTPALELFKKLNFKETNFPFSLF